MSIKLEPVKRFEIGARCVLRHLYFGGSIGLRCSVRAVIVPLVVQLLIFAPLVSRAANPNVALDIDPVFAHHGVLAVGYTNPQFQQMLLGLVGPENAAAIEPLRPYTLILKNANSAPITNVVVRYPRVMSTGPAVTGVMISKVAPTAIELASKDGLILTPESNVNEALNHLKGKSDKPFPATPAQTMQQAAGNISIAWGTRVMQGQVSLDSVEFADGGILGPDRMGYIVLERLKEAFENDISTRSQNVLITDDQFVQWINDLHDGPLPETKMWDTAAGQLMNYKKAFAFYVLGRLKRGKRSDLAALIKTYQSTRMPSASTLHPLN